MRPLVLFIKFSHTALDSFPGATWAPGGTKFGSSATSVDGVLSGVRTTSALMAPT